MIKTIVGTALACALAAATPARVLAQDPATVGGVSADILHLLERAAAKDGGLHLETVALLAIEADPARAPDILAVVAALAPERAAAIQAAAAAAYPDIALSSPATPHLPDVAEATVEQPADAPPEAPPSKGRFWSWTGWTGEAELSGARSTGNSDQTSVGLAGQAAHELGDWKHKFAGLLDLEESSGSTTKQRWLINYEPNYAMNDRAYMFGFFQYEDDRFGGFGYRFSESLGIGYQLVRTESVTWHLEGGPGARHIKYDGDGLTTEFTALFRSGFEWKISDGASFTHDFAFFWGTDQESIDTRAALRMRINGSLSGRLSYNYRYNSNVPITKNTVDTVTRAALVYEF